MDRLSSLVFLNGVMSREIVAACTEGELSPEEIAAGGPVLWRRLGCPEKTVSLLNDRFETGWAHRERERCAMQEISLTTWGSDEYPAALNRLPDPPLVLYRKGACSCTEGVGIVGTRRCSPYGRSVARDLAGRLSLYGRKVISGGARGIDTAGHEGCVDAGGKTLAVLGTGIDRVYPAANRALFERIIEQGALLSEFPLGFSARNWTFPRRNRLIAALSAPLVVVEAPARSGAIITARIALEVGRDVWSVPGRITDTLSAGSNALIADGAYPLVDVDQFLQQVTGSQGILDFGQEKKEAATREETARSLSGEEEKVYRLLREAGGCTVDNIAARAKMSATDVLRILGILSVEGIVANDGPGRWSAAGRKKARLRGKKH
ncbi:MAG: DNA-processing protein DprA [Thermovirgaceae bacterium]